MTNDTTTLNGALSELGETMADNLVAMGVLDASANDGLTTLAGKILCIEPSIGGLDLDTAVTLSASSASIVRGQSVVLTSKLTATYDDETLVNVDLSGVLTGATILFKEGNTTLGSGVTDSNGIATATIYDLAVGSHTIKAVFAGTDNFNDCESSSVSVTVTAPAVDSITLVKSAGKDILSYADVSSGTEFCTLTATVLDDNDDPIPGETVVLKKNNVTWDTLTTDSNGQVSKTYTSSGVGDLEFVAQCGSILSETYGIEDMTYVNVATSSDHKTDWISINNCLSSVGANGTQVYTTSNEEGLYGWNHIFDKDDDFIVRFEYVTGVAFTPILAFIYDGYDSKVTHIHRNLYDSPHHWKLYDNSTSNHLFQLINNGANEYHYDSSIGSDLVNGDIVTLKRVGTSMKLIVNGVELFDTPVNITDDFYMGFGSHSHANRSTTFKNWRICIL